jgi:SAM-dependent methyltransferase
LPDGIFDRAFSQFMVMNVADKAGVYREAFRVLKPGGRFVACHVSSGPNGLPEFPLPWAATSDHSFLASDEDTKRDFASAGFEITALRDTTQTPTMLATMRHKLETEGFPAVGSPCTRRRPLSAVVGQRVARNRTGANADSRDRWRTTLLNPISVSGGASENGAPRRHAGQRRD